MHVCQNFKKQLSVPEVNNSSGVNKTETSHSNEYLKLNVFGGWGTSPRSTKGCLGWLAGVSHKIIKNKTSSQVLNSVNSPHPAFQRMLMSGHHNYRIQETGFPKMLLPALDNLLGEALSWGVTLRAHSRVQQSTSIDAECRTLPRPTPGGCVIGFD